MTHQTWKFAKAIRPLFADPVTNTDGYVIYRAHISDHAKICALYGTTILNEERCMPVLIIAMLLVLHTVTARIISVTDIRLYTSALERYYNQRICEDLKSLV